MIPVAPRNVNEISYKTLQYGIVFCSTIKNRIILWNNIL